MYEECSSRGENRKSVGWYARSLLHRLRGGRRQPSDTGLFPRLLQIRKDACWHPSPWLRPYTVCTAHGTVLCYHILISPVPMPRNRSPCRTPTSISSTRNRRFVQLRRDPGQIKQRLHSEKTSPFFPGDLRSAAITPSVHAAHRMDFKLGSTMYVTRLART